MTNNHEEDTFANETRRETQQPTSSPSSYNNHAQTEMEAPAGIEQPWACEYQRSQCNDGKGCSPSSLFSPGSQWLGWQIR